MKRKVSTTPTKIWSYYCREVDSKSDGAKALGAQLYLAHQYANRLIEIERARREAYKLATYDVLPDLRVLDVDEIALTEQIEASKGSPQAERTELFRKRSEVWALQKKVRAELRAMLEPTQKIWKERAAEMMEGKGPRAREPLIKVLLEQMLAEQHSEFWKAVARSNATAVSEIKEARAHYVSLGLPNGTYLLVDKLMEAVRKSKSEPRFRRWSGEGRVGVQLRTAGSAREVLTGKSSDLQLEILKTLPNGKQHGLLKMRVGGTSKSPVWVEHSVHLHRPIPPDGVVKWAWIKVSKCGVRVRRDLQLTIEAQSAPRNVGFGECSVDFMWRETPEGVIAGVVTHINKSTRGAQYLITTVPQSIRSKIVYADHLRSVMDKLFNEAMPTMVKWLDTAPNVPDWCREDSKTIHLWNSPRRLSRVVTRLVRELEPETVKFIDDLWRDWRIGQLRMKRDLYATFDEREQFFVEQGPGRLPALALLLHLEWWRRKNNHLWQWESDQRENARLARLYLFRCEARGLASTFEFVSMPKTTGSAEFANRKKGSEMKIEEQRARADAAPYELRRCIAEAFGPSRVKLRGGHAKAALEEGLESARRGEIAPWDDFTKFADDVV